MKALSLILLFLAPIVCFGQITGFSIHAGPNVAGIPSKTTSTFSTNIPSTSGATVYTSASKIRDAFRPAVGFTIGGRLHYKMTGRIYFSSGLAVSQQRFKHETHVEQDVITLVRNPDYPSQGEPFIVSGQSQSIMDFNSGGNYGKTTAWFVQAPVVAGVKFFHGKLIVEGGAMVSATAYVSQYRAEAYYDGDVTSFFIVRPVTVYDPQYPLISFIQVRETKQDITNEFSTFSIGGLVRVGYQVTKRFQIDLSVSPSLTPLIKEQYVSSESKATTCSFGVNYFFWKKRHGKI